jgi:transcriptional regulator with XRE-family HTH domain
MVFHTSMTPGDMVRQARTDRGWSQRDLAKRASCSPASIALIERAHTLPSYGRCLELAAALDLKPDEFWQAVSSARADATSQRFHAVQAVRRVRSTPGADPDLDRALALTRTAYANTHVRSGLMVTLEALAAAAARTRRQLR